MEAPHEQKVLSLAARPLKGRAPTADRKVKIALVVSGAIALGSFESGVVTELVRAAQDPDSPVEIDVIGGASAGAITGATVAYYVTRRTRGGDGTGEYPAFSAWKQIDLAKLTDYGKQDVGLLSRSILFQQLDDVLGRGAAATPDPGLHSNDVLYFATMCNLHGRKESVRTAGDMDGVFVDIRYQNHSESVYIQIPACTAGSAQWTGRAEANLVGGVADRDLPDQARTAARTPEEMLWYKIFNYSLTSAALTPAWSPARHYNFANRPDIWWPNSAELQAQVAAQGDDTPLFFVDGGVNDNRPVLKMLDHALALRRLMAERKRTGGDPIDFAAEFPTDQGQPEAVAAMTPLIDPDRMLLFIEPDPIEIDKQDTEPEPEQSYNNIINAALRVMQVAGRTTPTYTDLEWVGFVNLSLMTALSDLNRAMEAERRQRTELAALRSRLQVAGTNMGADTVQESIGYEPDAAAMPAPDQLAPQPLRQAVDGFFAEWIESEGALDGAALNRVRRPVQTESGPTEWAPLAHLLPMLQDLRANYTELSRTEQVGIRRRLADMLHQRGLGGSTWVYVDRIAPVGAEQPLARTMGHFGGFVDQRWMAYDYDLGRKVALNWLLSSFPSGAERWRADATARRDELAATLTLPDNAPQGGENAAVVQMLLKEHTHELRRMLWHVIEVLDDALVHGAGDHLRNTFDKVLAGLRTGALRLTGGLKAGGGWIGWVAGGLMGAAGVAAALVQRYVGGFWLQWFCLLLAGIGGLVLVLGGVYAGIALRGLAAGVQQELGIHEREQKGD